MRARGWLRIDFCVVACFLLISACHANDNNERADAIVEYLSKNTFSMGRAEFVFVLDRSGSVGAANFELQRGFVESFLTHVIVDRDASRVAVISYSDTAECHIDYLRDPKNKCSLSQELQNVVFNNSRATNTAAALQKALEVFQSARPNVKKVLVLISDGLATLGGDPLIFSDRLKAMGVEIFCFGIGRFLKKSLLRLATSEQHVYSCSEFWDFKNLIRRIRGDSHETRWSAEASTPNCDHQCDSPYRGEPDDPGCCDHSAQCSCALQSGMYICACGPGFYGLSGLAGQCKACPRGTFKGTLEPSKSCTRCPAGSTTEKEASTRISDCICKEGFKGDPSRGIPCTLITCPPLQNPTHGFLWGECDFTFGSECNFACDEGYQLVHPLSDFRTCKSNGEWSGQAPICRQIRCNSLQTPEFGHMNCDDDMTVGSKCRFSCETGYIMEGPPERECLASARWSGKEVKCIPVQCGRAPRLPHGQVFGCQTEQRLSFKEACAFTCVQGFELVGPAFVICNHSGQLLSVPGYQEGRPACRDVTPPEISCPKAAVVKGAEEGKNYARIHLEMPEYADNSGIRPKLRTEPPFTTFPRDYPIGNYTVRFIATDHIGLESHCDVVILVHDDEPPTVVSCPSKVNTTTDNLLEPVFWDEPLFEDNSKQPVTIRKSASSGDEFGPGRHIVTYQAFDAMNNKAECIFDVIVNRNMCPYHPPPTNGALACNDWWYGQICHIYCNERYDFVEEPADWYTCTSDSNWETVPPGFSIPWPDCAKPAFPLKIRHMLKGFYYQGDCNDPQVSHHIKKMFLNSIVTELKKAELCVKEGTCSLQTVKVLCGNTTTTDHQLDGKTNSKRMKRDVWQLAEREDLELEFEITIDVDQELNNTEEMIHQFLETIQGLKWDTEDFEPQPTTTEATFYPSAGVSADLQYLLDPSNENETYEGSVVFTDDRTELVCRPGSVLKNEICVLCSPGTYHDLVTQKCLDCPLGHFQEHEGQTDCQRCPRGTNTESQRSRHEEECKGICQPGSFSATGLETCMACPVGTYQEYVGQNTCIECPDGSTTEGRRSTSVLNCRDTCEAGFHSKTGLTPCDPCPRGYYQSLSGQTVCDECPSNFSTVNEGARNASECLDLDPCDDWSKRMCLNAVGCVRVGRDARCVCREGFEGDHCEKDIDECEQEPCLNSAICINGEGSFWCNCSEGFTGNLCEVEVDECSSQPCVNNGTCMDKVNGYVCVCPYGFEGRNCERERDVCFQDTVCMNGVCAFQVEANNSYCACDAGYDGIDCSVEIDECLNVSCFHNGRCIDEIASFRCVCNSGFTGEFCEIDIDECEMNQCSESSTCQDLVGTYKCLCPPGYSGIFCETKQNSDFLLHFPESTATIANMATLTLQSPLSEVTVSMWVQTTDTVHSGTPLSYAVASVASEEDVKDVVMDNALTISDCSGVHVYVNNEPLVTDVRVADGQWHHLAFTWASDSGSWNLYKDGKLHSNGTNLKPTGVIQKGGTVVIGQEQDSVGGSFSPFETFTGNITRVNIWNSSFSKSNITRLCNLEDDIPGKVVAWPDFLQGIKGDVSVLNDERPSLDIEDL